MLTSRTHIVVCKDGREADRSEIMGGADEFGDKDSIGRSQEGSRVEAILVELRAEARLQAFLRDS